MSREGREIVNDYVARNDHKIKTTQPISMILVSFFSEDVLSDFFFNAIFSTIKVTKIERSAFLGDTRYSLGLQFPSPSNF